MVPEFARKTNARISKTMFLIECDKRLNRHFHLAKSVLLFR